MREQVSTGFPPRSSQSSTQRNSASRASCYMTSLSPQELLPQALQISVHTLDTRCDPSTELEWTLASSTHVPAEPSGSARTTASGLNTIRTRSNTFTCGRVRAVARSFNFGLQFVLCIWCACPDVTLPDRMVNVFRFIGDVEWSHIFRQLPFFATPPWINNLGW